ncbi:cytochrome P450 2L1-like [Macrobrachium nipponense]|uniref:cytochrome P450 2L1-like n=1 Tax=Macrobrachium nipponense TaxID=159736 RepID=UPI0030C8BB59
MAKYKNHYGLLYWLTRKPSSLPPGRWGLPIIGYIPLYTNNTRKIVSDLREQYGDIFTWKIGSHVFVGFCDYELIKTTFSRPECQGRPYVFSFDMVKFHSNAGIVSSVGDVWVQGRRFALRHLKDFGMGKSSFEGVIQYEAQNLVETFERTAGKPIEISWCLNVAVLNVIWKLVANIRYNTDDQEIIKFSAFLKQNIELIQGRIQCFVGKKNTGFISVFQEIIENHIKMLDQNNPKDYIDAYLIEIQKERGSLSTIFKDDFSSPASPTLLLNAVVGYSVSSSSRSLYICQLVTTTLSDLFGAGSETTSSTIRWLIALLATHPEIQRKMQKEIDEVVFNGTHLPSLLHDKDRLVVLCEKLH